MVVGADTLDIGDLAVEKGYLSPARLSALREEAERAREKGLAVPSIAELLTVRGYMSQETANLLEDELLMRSSEPPPSGRLAHYRLDALIGEGASGKVYRALDMRDGKTVALKVLPEALARNERYARRFIREARSAAVVKHPNVVAVYEVGRLGSTYFIAMELVEGADLEHVLAKRGRLEPAEALGIIRQIAAALVAARQAGIVHRDIKPGNIIIEPGGRARLVDLGLAKRAGTTSAAASATATADGVAIGTPVYMAPEQARDARRADHRADIYSLGATFYHLLAGVPPFDGDSSVDVLVKVSEEPPVPLGRRGARVPWSYVPVLERMMARQPQQRYQEPAALLSDLGRLAAGGFSAVAVALRNRLHLARRRLAAAASLLLLAALAVASVWAVRYQYAEYRQAKRLDAAMTVVIPAAEESPQASPPAGPRMHLPGPEQLEKTAADALAGINEQPLGTPLEARRVIGALRALASTHEGTAAAAEALAQAAMLEKALEEQRNTALADVLPGIETLANAMRYDTLGKSMYRLISTWGDLGTGITEKTRSIASERLERLRGIAEGIAMLAELNLVAEARRELDFLNVYWEHEDDRQRLADLYRALDATVATFADVGGLPDMLRQVSEALAGLRRGQEPARGFYERTGLPRTPPGEHAEAHLAAALAKLEERNFYYRELPALYRAGTLDALRRSLTGRVLGYSKPSLLPEPLRQWAELLTRTERLRRASGLDSADYRPTLALEPAASGWRSGNEPRGKVLPFAATPLIVARKIQWLAVHQYGAQEAPPLVTISRRSDNALWVEYRTAAGEVLQKRFSDADEAVLWGTELRVPTYAGLQSVPVASAAQLEIRARDDLPLLLAVADRAWLDGRFRTRRSQAQRLLQTLPPDEVYVRIEHEYPDCWEECTEAATKFADWLAATGRQAAAVEILLEAGLFADSRQLAGLDKAVEGLLAGGSIESRP